jgi:hypothetical protein
MSANFAITLSPNSFESRPRPFTMDERVWHVAVKLVAETGYRPNTFAGLDRTTTKLFARCLRQVLQQRRAKAGDRAVLTALLSFLEGAGAGGTTLSRGYKRWDLA